MAYTFKETVRTHVEDKERGIVIRWEHGYEQTPYPANFIYSEKDITVKFQLLFGPEHFYSKQNESGKEYRVSAMDSIHVLENTLKMGVERGYKQAGKGVSSADDYARIKTNIIEAFTASFTNNGESLPHLPDGKFHVVFEEDVRAYDTKHPGKLKNFDPANYPSPFSVYR